MTNPMAVIKFTPTLRNDTYPFISPTSTNYHALTDRSVLITGASKGIGRATAISFAQAGASSIALIARSKLDETKRLVVEAAKAAGREAPTVLCVACDTTSESEVARAAKEVEEGFGKLDILINNAGYLEDWKPLAKSDPSDWWRSWEVNVKGTYLVSRAFIPLLLKTSAGLKTIISISSMGGVVTSPNASAYQSSKTAQIRFTNFLVADYKEQGLLAFSVHPGGVKTELASAMPQEMQARLLGDTVELSGDSICWLSRERREWLGDRFVSAQWDMEELEGKRAEIEKGDLLKFKMAV